MRLNAFVRSRASLACVAMLLLSSSPSFAQGGVATTTLSGDITDPLGAVLPGAEVVAKNNSTTVDSGRRPETTANSSWLASCRAPTPCPFR